MTLRAIFFWTSAAVWMALFGLLVFTLGLLVFTLPAWAMSWYDYECCNERDCRQTTFGEVERHDDGWYVVQLHLTLPFNDPRVRRSLDPLIHVCMIPPGLLNGKPAGPPTLRCLYVPEVAG